MGKHWYYRKQYGDAGLNRKPPRLKDLGEHSIGIFVREVLQNNMDAAEKGQPVGVKIKISEWNKKQISNFFEFLGQDHIELLKKACSDPDPSVTPYLKDSKNILSNKKNNAFLITVEEKNCIGLLGPIRETKKEKSHFDALMRKVENNEAKKETTNTGGTWGKGSSIFTYTSQLWTWFSYTKLSVPWIDSNKVEHKKRFIGRCMLAPFFDEVTYESYLGDGWFCDLSRLETEKTDAYPFINEKADYYANKLGIDIRNKAPGTTFFIPFFNPQLESKGSQISLTQLKDEFVEQILKNWYIPIYNKELSVSIEIDTKIIVLNKEYLTSVPELKFKLELLDWYYKKCPPDKRFIKETIEIEVPALKQDFLTDKNDFAENRQKIKSELIVRIINEDEDFIDNWKTINHVGLSRNKGMIITNEEAIQSTSFRSESIYFAGLMSNDEISEEKRKHLDLFLAYSENPAHNNWCRYAEEYDRCFLERFERTRFKPEASIKYLFNEIYGVFKKLLGDEKESNDNKDICSIFKKLARLKSKGDVHGGKSLFQMRKIKEFEIDSQGRYIFERRIISNTSDNRIEVSFKSYIDSLEGERDKDFEYLGIKDFSHIELLDAKDNLIIGGVSPSIKLEPEEDLIVKIRTCKIENNPYFKNVDPFIKTTAKLISNE
ncbi:MAG: hypothetical protein K0S32_1540 [Bacteroidetes bacterium]|jgi:hypothetical protein|nr:hypothetical protein [Bacteroidota bacterium]